MFDYLVRWQQIVGQTRNILSLLSWRRRECVHQEGNEYKREKEREWKRTMLRQTYSPFLILKEERVSSLFFFQFVSISLFLYFFFSFSQKRNYRLERALAPPRRKRRYNDINLTCTRLHYYDNVFKCQLYERAYRSPRASLVEFPLLPLFPLLSLLFTSTFYHADAS